MNHASALMTSELIREAVDIARLSILELLRISDHAKPVFVYVVVLSPFERDDPNDPFGVLYERVIGEFFLDDADVNERKHRYRAIAHSKAVISRRTQMDTGAVAVVCPALFDGGDTHYEGGATNPYTNLPTQPGTCSDELQNQGETSTDCGGPCPQCGTPQKPKEFDGF